MIGQLRVPEHTKEAIDQYVKKGHPPGGFLEAVLTNNLSEAAIRADHLNRPALADIILYVYNNVPCSAWGSKKNVEAWVEAHSITHTEEAR